MKILEIKDNLGYYSVDGKTYIPINEINKEDLLKLVDVILGSDVDIDDFDDDQIKDPAHKIIYKNISEKFKDLNQKKATFKDESGRMFLKEYEKYK